GEVSARVFEGLIEPPIADYGFQWFPGQNVTAGAPLAVPTNQLEQGYYTLVAVDNVSPNRGCENFASIDVKFNKTTFSLTVDQTAQVLCTPLENGSVQVTGITEVLNGVQTPAADLTVYGFQWFDENGTAHPSTPSFVNGATGLT